MLPKKCVCLPKVEEDLDAFLKEALSLGQNEFMHKKHHASIIKRQLALTCLWLPEDCREGRDESLGKVKQFSHRR